MKPDPSARLLELAARIADGAPVDWADPATAEAGPETEELRTLEAMMTLRADGWTEPPAADPLPRLEGFRIERELGSGGAGVVYLAFDERLERRVAIKVLPAETALDPERLARLGREARLLASLNHPRIATIHGMGEDARGSQVMILEHVEGVTLAERLRAGRPKIAEALDLCGQIAEAIAAAHDGGVIHRDLKPGNVMIGPGGRVKVLDFGLARRRDPGAAGADVRIAGTWAYTSPERLARTEDHRADVFAFGCVLYECLAGRPAFTGATADEILAAVIGLEPDWSALPPDTPESIRQLLVSCLEKDPERRLPSMAEASGVIEGERHPDLAASIEEAIPGLPAVGSRFVGREREVTALRRALAESRRVTLVGAGGAGKTRLALQVARAERGRFEHLAFVDLAPLGDGSRVTPALASLLEVPDDGKAPLVERLIDRLGDARALVVLDNCEHVLGACTELVDALHDACPATTVVATSRAPLEAKGETRFAVGSMLVPDSEARDTEAIARCESVRLFVERARLAEPAFAPDAETLAAIGEICRRVEGLPLAIELAAARIRVLSAGEIAARLDRQLQLLRRTDVATGRHDTMRATIAWSVDQLAPDEARMLMSLAVFMGGWDLEAANAVAGDGGDDFEMLDLISRLVEKSLIVVQPQRGRASRYRLLEPVRQLVLERLVERGDEPAARARHMEHFIRVAEREQRGLFEAGQMAAFVRLDPDHDNFVAAIEVATQRSEGNEAALRMVAVLHRYWSLRGHLQVADAMCRRALAGAGPSTPPGLHAAALVAFSRVLSMRDPADRSEIRRVSEQALTLSRESGGPRGIAESLSLVAAEIGRQGDYLRARETFEHARDRFREAGDDRGLATAIANIGVTWWIEGDLRQAIGLVREALALQRDSGDQYNSVIAATNVAILHLRLGEPREARAPLLEALDLYLGWDARTGGSVAVVRCAAEYALAMGQFAVSARLYGAVDGIRRLMQARGRDAIFTAKDEPARKRLLEALGEEGLERELEAGRAMAPRAAMEHAARFVRSTPA